MRNELAAELTRIGIESGLCRVGFTSADVLEPAATVLELRKSAGLHDTMAFTYRNPARSTDPTRTLPTAKSLIAAAYDYRRQPVESSATSAKIARYSHRDHYAALRDGLEAMASHLRACGHRAQVRADDNAIVDRNVAWRAGLGWYGKNANLLTPEVGSWVILGCVITDAELPASGPPVADGCGPCRRCIDACPTDAIVAPGVIDATRCLAWLVQGPGPIPVEFREAVGDRLYGCDDCQDVCPPNLAAAEGADLPMLEDDVQTDVDPVWVVETDDLSLMASLGRFYIADRNPDILRRTALVVMGNTAHPDDQRVLDVLDRVAASDNALLAEHAVWARQRLIERARHSQ